MAYNVLTHGTDRPTGGPIRSASGFQTTWTIMMMLK